MKHGSRGDENIPVIVGAAQLIDKPLEAEDGLEPLELMLRAIKRADEDSLGAFLKRVDSVDIENISSWSYANVCQELCERLDISPVRCVYNDISGDMPIRNLCDAAACIASGESSVALICGAEALWTVQRAGKTGSSLSLWTKQTPSEPLDVFSDLELSKYQVYSPVSYYALFENACRHAFGQTFDEAQHESAVMWSRASHIAEQNEYAWIRRAHSEDEIKNVSATNRLLSWPYTKLMVANNFVNGATAIIVTSLAQARMAGIRDENLIYIEAGAYAAEHDDVVKRDRLDHSAAMQAVLTSLGSIREDEVDLAELYSCFPVVPKLAKRILGWSDEKELTVTGGMTFCGGQLTNFMSQGAVSMVEKLRKQPGRGLLYGNGHFLTHAAGAVLSSQRPAQFNGQVDVQEKANSLMSKAPRYIPEYAGPCSVETFTVSFDREGSPESGLVIARTPDAHRFAAKTAPGDNASLQALLATTTDVIGLAGRATTSQGLNYWCVGI